MEYNKLSIKQWALEDRPREKLLQKGISSLSDAEIIAILIGSGTRELSAVELAKNILHGVKNRIDELAKLSVNDLTKIKGIGEAKAINIVAALELGRRRKLSEAFTNPKITSSKDVADIFSPILSDLLHEEFWILLLNRANTVIDKVKISQGGVAGTVIDVKLILKPAIEKLASSIILCHNHPSGNLSPSSDDKAITEKIKNGAMAMDIKLLDHIIVSLQGYFSFVDEGIL
jgi:DNA repair protein RadC